MAISEIHEYDPETREVTIRDASGMLIGRRPYTDAENAIEDAKAVPVNNEETLRTGAEGAISTLLTSITALKAITDKTNANIGPADTKDLARELRQVTRQLLRLTRIVTETFDTADVGAE
jgi:hypothetical protein